MTIISVSGPAVALKVRKMKSKKALILALAVIFFLLFSTRALGAQESGNLLVNGNFETEDTTGWTWDKGTTGTGTWVGVVEPDLYGNHYLKMAKDWWGYNRFYQDITGTTADLDISCSLRPVQLGTAGVWSIQEGVSFMVALFDDDNVRRGYVQHYFATYHTYTTTGANINIKLGNAAQTDWVQVSYNLKDLVLSYDPTFDFSEITLIRVYTKLWQAGHAREWAIGYFDDVSVKIPTIPAEIDINPDTLNTKSKGKWITAYLQLPAELDVYDIDVSTVTLGYLDETIPAEEAPVHIGDENNDGILDLMVKFKRADVTALLAGINGYACLTVSGELTGCGYFLGEDDIRVKSK